MQPGSDVWGKEILVFGKSELLGNLSRHLFCLQDWSSVKLLKTPQGIQMFGKGNWRKPPNLPESARRLHWRGASGLWQQQKCEADCPCQCGVAGQECWLCEGQGEGVMCFEEHCCVWQLSTNQLSAYQAAFTQHKAPDASSYLQTSSGLLAKKGSEPWGSLRGQVWSSGSDESMKCQLSGWCSYAEGAQDAGDTRRGAQGLWFGFGSSWSLNEGTDCGSCKSSQQ